MNTPNKQTAIFGGGCFWCTEAVFQMLKGVSAVSSGYAGGTTTNPTYEQVSSGKTGHAEVIKIEYDPAEIDYRDLLTVFFASHNATTLNQQGNDIGTQYRSVIFYTTALQKQLAEDFVKELNASASAGAPIVTTIDPLEAFYPAEDYHQDYYKSNSFQPYCQVIIEPKLEKVQQKFAELLKKNEAA